MPSTILPDWVAFDSNATKSTTRRKRPARRRLGMISRNHACAKLPLPALAVTQSSGALPLDWLPSGTTMASINRESPQLLRPRLAPTAASLPETVPFVGPEALERQRGTPFLARLGANESP